MVKTKEKQCGLGYFTELEIVWGNENE